MLGVLFLQFTVYKCEGDEADLLGKVLMFIKKNQESF